MKQMKHNGFRRVISGIVALLLIVGMFPAGALWEVNAEQIPVFTVNLVDAEGNPVTGLDGQQLTLAKSPDGAAQTVTIRNGSAVFANFVEYEVGASVSYTASIADATGYEYQNAIAVTEEAVSANLLVTALQKTAVHVKVVTPEGIPYSNAVVTYTGYTSGTVGTDAVRNGVYTFEGYVGKEYMVKIEPAEHDVDRYAGVDSQKVVIVAGENSENGVDFGTFVLKARYALHVTGIETLGSAEVKVNGVVQSQIPQSLIEGVSLDVTVRANNGSRIKYVKYNGVDQKDTSGKKEFSIHVDKVESVQNIQAALEEIYYYVTVNSGNGGSVTVNGAEPGTNNKIRVQIDTVAKAEITPDAGKQIKELWVNDTPIPEAAGSKVAYTCDLGQMAADVSVAATFETAVYQVSVNDYTGESGNVNGEVTVNGEKLIGAVKELNYHTETVIKIAANKGYRIGSMRINGEEWNDAAGKKEYNIPAFRIQSDCDVVVSFVPKTYTITFSYEEESGEVEAWDGDSKLQEIVDGKLKIDTADPKNVTVTAQANDGKRIAEVEVINGSLKDKQTTTYELNTDDTHSCVFNLVDEDGKDTYSYSVTFADERYWNVIVNGGEALVGGQIKGLPSAAIAHMDSHGDIEIIADSENGYEIKSLKVNHYSEDTDSVEMEELVKGKNQSYYKIPAAVMRRDMKIEVVFGLKTYITSVKTVGEDGKPASDAPVAMLVNADGEAINGKVEHGQTIKLKIDQNGKMRTVKEIEISMENNQPGNVMTTTKTAGDLVEADDSYIYTLDIKVTGNTNLKVTYADLETVDPGIAGYLDNDVYDTTFNPDYLRPAYTLDEGENEGYIVYIMKAGADSYVEFSPKQEKTALRYNDSHGYMQNKTHSKQNSFDIENDTKINNITASNHNKTVALNVKMLLVFDGKAPELTMDYNPGWVNTEDVVVKMSAVDAADDGDFGQSAGLDYIVWSTQTVSDADVIALKDTQMLDFDEESGTWSHVLTGEQSQTYYYYAVDKVGNVSSAKSAQVQLEHTKPEVDPEGGFRFVEKNGDASEEITASDEDGFDWFVPGLIHNEDLLVTVTATDTGLSSGLKEMTLYYVDPANPGELKLIGTTAELDYSQSGKHIASATFELKEEQFANGAYLLARVVDFAGNHNDVYFNHGVQITRAKPAVMLMNPVKTWNGDDVTISFEMVEKVRAANGASYLDQSSLEIYIDDVRVEPAAVEVIKTVSDVDQRIESLKVTVNTKSLSDVHDGRHEIDIRIANNAGTYNKALDDDGVPVGSPDAVVYIDRTNPEMIGFGLEGQVTEAVYGNFDNDTVQITISVRDANASNGIAKVFLYNKLSENGEPVLLKVSEEVEPGENAGEWKTVFEYPLGEDPLYARLWIKTVDNVGRESELINISAVSELSDLLILENTAPNVGVSYQVPNVSSYNQATWNGEHWYAGDVEFKATLTEGALESGLHHSALNINADPEQGLGGYVVANEYIGQIVPDQEHTINTGSEGAVMNEDGSYTLTLTVVDNAGNEQKEFLVNGQGEPVSSVTVYKDLHEPKIDRFVFSTANGNPERDPSAIAVGTTYGYYFKQDTIVTIYADDVRVGAVDENGEQSAVPSSGVKTITYRLVNEKGETIGKPVVAEVSADGTVEVPIKAGFKGQIFAYATDNVGRTKLAENGQAEERRPDGVIVETQNQHDTETHVEFKRGAAPATTAKGGDLYDAMVPVTITVTDTFSGIRSFEWSVASADDSAQNQSGKLTIDEDFANGMPVELTDSNGIVWKVISTDSDLITSVQAVINVANNSNDIVVNVSMEDRSGNRTENVQDTFSIDTTAPKITITYQEATRDSDYTNYYRTDRVMVIQIQERNFNGNDFVYAITNGDEHADTGIPALEGWTPGTDNGKTVPHDSDVYTATIRYHADGDYKTNMSYTDLAGFKANVVEEQIFTIDQTKPTVTVSYTDTTQAVNGYYYKGQRVAHITITEHNFDSKRVRIVGTAVNDGTKVTFPSITKWSGGDKHTATITYSADAEYTFDIEFLDMAGNSIENFAPQTFVVDNIDPVITITGVEDKSANNGVVAPVIEVTDVNFDQSKVQIELIGVNSGVVNYSKTVENIHNGQVVSFADFEHKPEVDDIYTLRVTVTDKSGRTMTHEILFSTNRFGSTYDLTELEDINGTYVQQEKDLIFYEVNADELVEGTIRVKLTKNGETRELVENVDYVIEDEVGQEGKWHRYKYVLYSTLFADDGTYNVAVYSVDKATNVNENIDEVKKADIIFGVDKTLPVVVVSGLESNEQYNENEKSVTVQIKDNLVLESVVILLNGEKVDYTVDGENYTFVIPESKDIQDVQIIATDASGREQIISLDRITVTTDYFILWYRNVPLFVSTLIGIAGLIVGTYFFLLAKKKKKEEENR